MNIGTRLVNVSLAAAVTGILLGSLSFTPEAAATPMIQLRDNVSRAVGHATLTGHHDPSQVLGISVALSLQHPDQLAAFRRGLHDPMSHFYRQYLTPAQFTRLFGPSKEQVRAVEQFLTQRGIKVTEVSPNNLRVYASASVATLESAFGVAVNDYRRADGTSFYAASGDPSLPANLGYVKAVMGLSDSAQYKPHLVLWDEATAPTPKGLPSPLPAGFSPQQIATAYNWYNPNHKPQLTDTTLASGVTIAIGTAFTYRKADVQKFWSTYGLPSHTLTNVAVGGLTTRIEVETTLDIERSSAMSPGSNIVVYESANPSDTGFDAMFMKIANDANTPNSGNIKVMSTSWGLAENESAPASIAAEHDAFVQLDAEGVAMMAAAGDNAAEDGEAAGTDNADFPASDDLVLAAGGTNLVLGTNNVYGSETAWSNAGGADSIYFAEPSYESTVSGWQPNTSCTEITNGTFTPVPLSSTAAPALGADGCATVGAPSRQSSDMSMDADPATAYSFYANGRWGQAGGTSFVAPELAGFFAMMVKKSGGAVGIAPQLVFCAATHGGGANYATDFQDIQSGQNSGVLGGTFVSGAGWDHPTGWGTPNAADLLADILANCES